MRKKLNWGALIGLLAGIALLAVGLVKSVGSAKIFSDITTDSSSFSRTFSSASDYSFGADFYTEMYGITYDVLNQLNGMSAGNTQNLSVLNNNIVSGMKNVYDIGCLLVMAIGAGIAALSASRLCAYVPDERGDEKALLRKALKIDAKIAQLLEAAYGQDRDSSLPQAETESGPESAESAPAFTDGV